MNQMQGDGVISRYAIGRAIGALFYLEPVLTKDSAIFVVLPNFPETRIVSLTQIYQYLLSRGFTVQEEYVVISDWPVQFLPATTALEVEALEQAMTAQTEGVEASVMTAEHLLAICLDRTSQGLCSHRTISRAGSD